MRRREVITLVGGAAAWPFTAGAEPARPRRLGALFVISEGIAAPYAALREGLRRLGWTEGGNLELDLRFGGGDPGRIRRYTEELIALKPDVIFAQGVVGAAAMQHAPAAHTRAVPSLPKRLAKRLVELRSR
jgi:putative tryptophan/tyrosine transport system substrate-binding protein